MELLVVIAMIGFLFSLLLPAIHAARESAQSIEAANTTKTVCFALLND